MSDQFDDVTAPAVDEPNAPEAPESPQDEPQVSEEDAIFGNLPDDLPPDLKPHLERVEGQWKSNYTKKRQEEKAQLDGTMRDLEQYRQIVDSLREGDPTTRQSMLNLLGLSEDDVLSMYNLEKAEQEAEEQGAGLEDDFEFRDPRVDQLLSQQQQAQAQAEAEALADQQAQFMEDEVQRLYGGKEPDEKELNFIFNYAMNNPDQLGRPDIQTAVADLKARDEARMKEWLDSRKGPRATTPGIPGSPHADTSTKEGRIAEMARAVEEVRASQ